MWMPWSFKGLLWRGGEMSLGRPVTCELPWPFSLRTLTPRRTLPRSLLRLLEAQREFSEAHVRVVLHGALQHL